MSTRVIKVAGDEDEKVSVAAEEAARALRKGLLVGFATETVYGVAAVATIAETMDRLRELKSRPARPFSVHLGRPADAGRYVRHMPDAAERLIHKAWPGPVTLLVPTGGHLADPKLRRRAGLYERLCFEDTVGLRCPDERVACEMLRRVWLPVVAPSANRAGEPSPRTAEQVLDSLDGQIDLLIDSGPTRLGLDSTIVRCDADGWSVVREGVFRAAAVERMLKRKVLFVCTGNTCRSPMAAGLARNLVAERLGCRPAELAGKGVEVLSAGVFAGDGLPATDEAVAAAAERGADIAAHRSRKLTRQLIADADMVFCMTDSHVAETVRLAPELSANVRKLEARGDLPDPIGGGPAVYRTVAERIERALRAVFEKGLP